MFIFILYKVFEKYFKFNKYQKNYKNLILNILKTVFVQDIYCA